MPKTQKSYSLPLAVAEWVNKILEENKQDLSLLGITNETKLLEVLAKNGEQSLRELLDALKEKKKASRKLP
jgi:hypothetical protein